MGRAWAWPAADACCAHCASWSARGPRVDRHASSATPSASSAAWTRSVAGAQCAIAKAYHSGCVSAADAVPAVSARRTVVLRHAGRVGDDVEDGAVRAQHRQLDVVGRDARGQVGAQGARQLGAGALLQQQRGLWMAELRGKSAQPAGQVARQRQRRRPRAAAAREHHERPTQPLRAVDPASPPAPNRARRGMSAASPTQRRATWARAVPAVRAADQLPPAQRLRCLVHGHAAVCPALQRVEQGLGRRRHGPQQVVRPAGQRRRRGPAGPSERAWRGGRARAPPHTYVSLSAPSGPRQRSPWPAASEPCGPPKAAPPPYRASRRPPPPPPRAPPPSLR